MRLTGLHWLWLRDVEEFGWAGGAQSQPGSEHTAAVACTQMNRALLARGQDPHTEEVELAIALVRREATMWCGSVELRRSVEAWAVGLLRDMVVLSRRAPRDAAIRTVQMVQRIQQQGEHPHAEE